MISPGSSRRTPIRRWPSPDDACDFGRARFSRLNRTAYGSDATIHDTNDRAAASLACRPDLVDSEVLRHICNGALGGPRRTIACSDRASGETAYRTYKFPERFTFGQICPHG